MASRRKFSDEYKREAVRLATEPGVTKSQVDAVLVAQERVATDYRHPGDDRQRRREATDPANPEFGKEREDRSLPMMLGDDPGDQVPGDHEKDIDPDEASRGIPSRK
jgi:hypothetical protein